MEFSKPVLHHLFCFHLNDNPMQWQLLLRLQLYFSRIH